MFWVKIKRIMLKMTLLTVCVYLCACVKENPSKTNTSDGKQSDTNNTDQNKNNDDISKYIGCWKYESGEMSWYIDIKNDGTFEQVNEFAESMDEGMWTNDASSLKLDGEEYSDVLTAEGASLITKSGVTLTRDEMPVPDMPQHGSGYDAYTGNWYISADMEPKLLLILESDYTWSLRSTENVLAQGEVKGAEEGFDLMLNSESAIASVYTEDDGTLTLNIYETDELKGLPQTCRFTREHN